MKNSTNINFLLVLDKIYEVSHIDFSEQVIEATETSLSVPDVPGQELFSVMDFEEFRIVLSNRGVAKIIDFELYKNMQGNHCFDNDDQILQDLLETNIRQRGDVGGSAKKVGKRIQELERIYGVYKGNHVNEKPNNSVSQSDIASMMGISVDTISSSGPQENDHTTDGIGGMQL